MVTTDEVLAEFLTAMSKSGQDIRRRAVLTVREALNSGAIRVVHSRTTPCSMGSTGTRLDQTRGTASRTAFP